MAAPPAKVQDEAIFIVPLELLFKAVPPLPVNVQGEVTLTVPVEELIIAAGAPPPVLLTIVALERVQVVVPA